MALASALSFPQDSTSGLDEMLFQVCEEFQLTPARYDQAVERYSAVGDLLGSYGSPFRQFRPKIYPQGSMALGTTVKPVKGPHDLDFVLELSLVHEDLNPMVLIQALYDFLRAHGTYGPMTSMKTRCVRIEYANDFYMDVLPACRSAVGVGTCIKVPDRSVRGWSDSDPLEFIRWFEEQCKLLRIDRLLEKAAPIPAQQAVAEKKALQLIVQLLKRWRDRYYAHVDPDLAPISIVLTTLAGQVYTGEQSVSKALGSCLRGIVGLIDFARGHGDRLRVWNPSPNVVEDLSERWDANPGAFEAFEEGVREFDRQWSQLIARDGNVNAELEALFGEPVTTVLKKRSQQLQESRVARKLGVTSSGIITSAGAAVVAARPNTFYGEQ